MISLRTLFRDSRSLSQIAFRGLRSTYREEKVVANEDGSIIVAWHPEPKFPYELTQPVPRKTATEQTMKVQAVEDMKELYHHKNERFARRDLMRLTWTPKYRWFQSSRAQSLYKRKPPPRERPYL